MASRYVGYKRSQFGTPGIFGLFFNEKLFTDAKIASSSDIRMEVSCHRVILSAVSNIFKSKFLRETDPNKTVYVGPMSYNNLLSIMKLIYEGSVRIRDDENEDFLSAVRSLNIRLEPDMDRIVYDDFDTSLTGSAASRSGLVSLARGVVTYNSSLKQEELKPRHHNNHHEHLSQANYEMTPPMPVPAPQLSIERDLPPTRNMKRKERSPERSRFSDNGFSVSKRLSGGGGGGGAAASGNSSSFRRGSGESKEQAKNAVAPGPFGKFWLVLNNPLETTVFGIKDKFGKFGLDYAGGSMQKDEDLYMAFNNTTGAMDALKTIGIMTSEPILKSVTYVPDAVLADFQKKERSAQIETKKGLHQSLDMKQLPRAPPPPRIQLGQLEDDYNNRMSSSRTNLVGYLMLENFPNAYTKVDFLRELKDCQFNSYSQTDVQVFSLGKAKIGFFDKEDLKNAVNHFDGNWIHGRVVRAFHNLV